MIGPISCFLATILLAPRTAWPDRYRLDEVIDGVELYQWAGEHEPDLLPFKAIKTVAVPLDKLVTALTNLRTKPLWSPKLKRTKLHNQIDARTFIVSEYYETPWPFYDREFCLRGTVARSADKAIFAATSIADKRYFDDDHVQANVRTLTVVLNAVNPGKTRVEMVFQGDMGGWIPGFVRRIIQRKWPVRFIQALERFGPSPDNVPGKVVIPTR